MSRLSVSFAGVELRNPTVLASGILGSNACILKRVAREGAGAVTMKSIGPEKREGHNNPTVLAYGQGIINAVGLPSPGYKNMEKEWDDLKELEVPLVASIYGGSVEEFREVAEFTASKKPAMIEINISCPNTKEHGQIFGTNPELTEKVVSVVKDVSRKIPVMPKLTPNTERVVEVAKACEEAGADAISAFNTFGPGMLIDINKAKPILAFKTGGISGPAIKPLVIKGIYDLYENVSLPILAIGGITYGKDAIEAIMAGATAVGMGSSVHYRGIDVFRKVCSEIESFMKEHGYKKVEDMRGLAHE